MPCALCLGAVRGKKPGRGTPGAGSGLGTGREYLGGGLLSVATSVTCLVAALGSRIWFTSIVVLNRHEAPSRQASAQGRSSRDVHAAPAVLPRLRDRDGRRGFGRAQRRAARRQW